MPLNESWRQDFSLRLLALLLAVVIWFVVGRGSTSPFMAKSEPVIERTFPVIVAFMGVPSAEVVTFGQTVEPASVLVSGPQSKVEKIARVTCLVDASRLSQAGRTTRTVAIEARLIPLDSEGSRVTGVRLRPEAVFVSLWLERPELREGPRQNR